MQGLYMAAPVTVPLGIPGVAAAGTAAAAGAVASAPAGSLSTSGSLGRSAAVPVAAAAAAAGAIGARVLASSHEQMPAELRLSAARAERKKKTEVRLVLLKSKVFYFTWTGVQQAGCRVVLHVPHSVFT
jgi:hypothetical protein